MAALAMRPRLPAAPAPARCSLQPPAAACCCSRSLLLMRAAARGLLLRVLMPACCLPHAVAACRVLCLLLPTSQRAARCAQPRRRPHRAPSLAGEEVFLVTVQHLEFNISIFDVSNFNILFVQFQYFFYQILN